MGRQVDQLQASIQSQLEGVSGEMYKTCLLACLAFTFTGVWNGCR